MVALYMNPDDRRDTMSRDWVSAKLDDLDRRLDRLDQGLRRCAGADGRHGNDGGDKRAHSFRECPFVDDCTTSHQNR